MANAVRQVKLVKMVERATRQADIMREILEALPENLPEVKLIHPQGLYGARARVVLEARTRFEAAEIMSQLHPMHLNLVKIPPYKHFWTDEYMRSGHRNVQDIKESQQVAPFVLKIDQGQGYGPNVKVLYYAKLKEGLVVHVDIDLPNDKAGFAPNAHAAYWPNESVPDCPRIGYWGQEKADNAYLMSYWPLLIVTSLGHSTAPVELAHFLLETESD